ncbi:hypothetical protein [Roseibacillus persicicus]|uniref:hypothetical protein n=1 Tax=Roseibacillus persicicus TaxID=454148 RepID=UPI00280D11A1|nr:hypothetical protein [Roseibacillus persicicus]MDQ8192190.1 hypothetical protein [Roseibacillus persicicus]
MIEKLLIPTMLLTFSQVSSAAVLIQFDDFEGLPDIPVQAKGISLDPNGGDGAGGNGSSNGTNYGPADAASVNSGIGWRDVSGSTFTATVGDTINGNARWDQAGNGGYLLGERVTITDGVDGVVFTDDAYFMIRRNPDTPTGNSNPTFHIFDNILITADTVDPVILSVSQVAGALDFSWESTAGYQYDLLSSTDLSTPPSEWLVHDDGAGLLEDIAASGTGTNSLVGVALSGEQRFFTLREEEVAPTVLLTADFEASDGSFTMTNKGTGSPWEFGLPDSEGPGGVVAGGSSGTTAWGTSLGDASTPESGSAGFYEVGTSTCLSTPVLDLTGFTISATLGFSQNMDFPADDTAEVYVVSDTTGEVIGTGAIFQAEDMDVNETDWETVSGIELPAEALGQAVRIEFRFSGDGGPTNDFLGWYIDDVSVEAR